MEIVEVNQSREKVIFYLFQLIRNIF